MKVESKETAQVRFVSALEYFRPGTQKELDEWERQGVIKKMNDYRQLVFKSRKELIIECDDHVLMDKLFKLATGQDTFFPQIKPLCKWMDKEGITYWISDAKSSKI